LGRAPAALCLLLLLLLLLLWWGPLPPACLSCLLGAAVGAGGPSSMEPE
jgi:hypothetical protein